MDPLTAVGLAGTVAQFVTFACSLLSKSSEIHNSVTGKAADLTNIWTVHEHLKSFSAKFILQESIAARLASTNGTDDSQDISALKEVLQACKTDCDQILKLIDKLTVKDGPCRRWRSFRAALELVWKRNEVEELDKRLQRSQSALTLHMCAMTRYEYFVDVLPVSLILYQPLSRKLLYGFQKVEKHVRNISDQTRSEDRECLQDPADNGKPIFPPEGGT
jgi:hypothetical protein